MLWGYHLRIHRSDVHCDVAGKVLIPPLELYQNGNSLVAVEVATENAAAIHYCRPAHANILANFLHQRLSSPLDSARFQVLNVVGATFKYRVGDLTNESKKIFISRNEVSFAVDFYQNAEAAILSNSHGNHAICRNTARLFGRFHTAGLSQCLNRRFNVVVGLSQRLLALQQSKAGTLAQLFH